MQKEGKPFEATILDIKPAYPLGGDGNFPVAVVCKLRERRREKAWYPLPEGHNFRPGNNIIVTPVTEYHESGGSTTEYRIIPKS